MTHGSPAEPGRQAAGLIPGDVRQVLLEAVVDGDRVVLAPAGGGEARRAACALLEASGGIGGAGGYAFPGLAPGAVLAALLSDEVPPGRADCDASPPGLAALLLGELGDDLAGLVLLEPSAGQGAIAIPAAKRGAVVDCIEVVPEYARHIGQAGLAREVICADFLAIGPQPRYGAVVMHPPSVGGTAVDHVMRAVQWAQPGGRIVAVLPAAVTTRRDVLARQLRLLATATGTIRPVPAGVMPSAAAAGSVYVSFTRPGLTPRPRTRHPAAAAAGGWAQPAIF
jgi:hypothetical protein